MLSLFAEVFGIAVALSIDAVVVALCWSTVQKHVAWTDVFKFAVTFGLFQGLMPAAGWLAGSAVANLISQWDHWLAFALLTWVAVNMVREGLEDEQCDVRAKDGIGGVALLTLITLAVATSLDALAVGFSFALAAYPIVWPAIVIAVVCFALTAVAVVAGKHLSERAAAHTGKLSIAGAAVLFAIGLKILYEHQALAVLGL